MHKIGIPLAPFKSSIARLLGPIIHTHTHMDNGHGHGN